MHKQRNPDRRQQRVEPERSVVVRGKSGEAEQGSSTWPLSS